MQIHPGLNHKWLNRFISKYNSYVRLCESYIKICCASVAQTQRHVRWQEMTVWLIVHQSGPQASTSTMWAFYFKYLQWAAGFWCSGFLEYGWNGDYDRAKDNRSQRGRSRLGPWHLEREETYWLLLLGISIPPFFSFTRKKFLTHFILDGPTGCVGAADGSGWMQEQEFLVLPFCPPDESMAGVKGPPPVG